MKHSKIKAFVATLIVGSMVAACDIETSNNGKLDGYWRLERVDTLHTGGVLDLSQRRVFWAVQAKLLYLRDADHADSTYMVRFRQTADSLILSNPYAYRWHQDQEEGGDHLVTDVNLLRRFGLNAVEEHFEKEHLSGSRMTLKNRQLRLYFKKF